MSKAPARRKVQNVAQKDSQPQSQQAQAPAPANIVPAIPRDLSKMTVETAIELCKTQPAAAGQMLINLLRSETTALPGTVFVRREDGAFLKRYQVAVRLTEADGHLIRLVDRKIKTGYDKQANKPTYQWVPAWDYAITGLRKINEICALQIIKPREIAVAGKTQMNPYIEIDESSKMPTVVYARCLAIGYSPMGTLVATDVMVRLDVNIYLLENIQAKLAALEDHADNLAQYGTAENPPDNVERARWTFMPTHSVGGIGLWVNMAHAAFARIMSDHTTRMKFIERLAQSFAERNALKAHPSIPKTMHAENGVAQVRASGWTTDFKREEIDQLRTLVEADKLHEFKDKRSGEGIEVKSVNIDTLDDAERASLEQEVHGEQGHEKRELNEEEEGPAEERDPEQEPEESRLDEAMELFVKVSEMSGRSAAKQMVKDAGLETLESANEEELAGFIELAQKAMEG